ncbi:lipoprotein-releasing ABC transporter permease subunit [Salinisphaera hydrothermalis]|uniref:Lipoprotein releasing system transmembrane protein LolC n=1 Tax=Salinisphaera hydrothermalis (strain C41B8) TaxID=1304275 RepID=A0A084IJN5_SALHC|nr:lipoprotein-releasing ABC transporter permease subunit [Salinisphaera hydrothermalis]KEZ76919.1 Lipoprotein releasing system transmembrane protein LolC [Salinisphaera hydrothermalis C41B8]
MFRPLELALGLRYTRAKRRNHFISFISSISMGGIALAVMLLITVLSVMNGFESELRNRILGMAAHVEIQSTDGALQGWQDLRKEVDKKTPQLVASAPYVSGQGMVRSGRSISGTLIRGVVPSREKDVSDVASHMVAGSFDSLKGGTYNIVLGVDLANQLGVGVGDNVDLLIPEANVTPAGIVPRFRRFHVTGIFSVGMYEYDSGMVLISMKDAQTLYHMGDGVSGLRLRLKDMFKAPQVSHQLSQILPYRYRVTDWTQQNANFFHAVATEKTMMFIILSLIIAVAAFNIVSMLVMVVTDKQGDIAILRTLGMKPRSVMAIFMIQGMLIGVIGTVIGVILGVLLSVNMESIVPFVEKVLHTNLLSADVYYISQLKGELHESDVIRICGLSLVLSFLSTLYPAWRAARVQPAEALRYE